MAAHFRGVPEGNPPGRNTPSGSQFGGSRRGSVYDGPGSPRQNPASPRMNPFGPGLGFDPAKPQGVPRGGEITNSRVELPSAAYSLNHTFLTLLPDRNGYGAAGKKVTVRVNQYKVLKWPERDVYQYDILIGTGAEKRGKVMAVWKSKAVQQKLAAVRAPWLWDGNKIAWSSAKVGEVRIAVDLDAEKGREPRAGREPDVVYVIIRPSTAIRMAVIQAYLKKQIPFDTSILEAINFLDHLMRQTPSEKYTMIKRSFFAKGAAYVRLDNFVVAMKGVYSSIRLCNAQAPSNGISATGLAINVDVANGTFWEALDVSIAARNFLKERNRNASWDVFRSILKPIKDNKTKWTMSDDFKNLRKMTKLKFVVKHRGKNDDTKIYSIKRFTWEINNGEGAHSKNTYFKFKDRNNNNAERDISVYEYFRKIYSYDIQMWDAPLVVSNREGMFPMELCTLCPNQRFNFKLSPDQTANMIKFAVTRPKQRIEAINHGIDMLDWKNDKYLKHFGLEIENKMTETNARVIQNPEIQFAGAKLNPGTSGRWDLRGKKFFAPNTEPLKSWGFCVVGQCVPEATLKNFIGVFIQTYVGHGGKIANKQPLLYMQPKGEDLAVTVANFRNQVGNQQKAMPQILFYVLPVRDSWMYERLKRNTECRFAHVSQCMNFLHVQKAQPQYCSNVCMKVNAKLGGITSRVVTPKDCFFPRPTMIIGADVSHPAPGSQQPSMSALTMSMDKHCARFAAAVQTNGVRVEMITPNNIETGLTLLARQWPRLVGAPKGPQHIYYFRDGVSEGQYAHVLNQEVADLKKVMATMYPEQKILWTVVVCTKRHHIRFFPKEGDGSVADKNNNPVPGTIVERDVTHPFEYDFYLNAHSAIQGTSRPVHYQVLLDEAQVGVDELQKMIYQFSYQYMRSTTPVSIFPAIYYAHLASNRAACHHSHPASAGPQGGQKGEEARQEANYQATLAANRVAHGQAPKSATGDGSSQTGSSVLDVLPLVPLGSGEITDQITALRCGMWYI